ncbi:MAG: gamma-glutamyltransferase family protein, partial [Terriglobales bacterium]
GYDLGKLGNRSADAIHVAVEAFRRAFYDRAEFLGDPDFGAIPVAQLLDKRYAAAWRQSLDPAHATRSAELARPTGIFQELDQVAGRRARAAAPVEGNHTTHLSVVDAEGNAVSLTTTLNDFMGSRVTADGLGFLLNNEMDDFRAKPGVPNESGLIQGEANAIAPGKRPLSSMTPTMVLKDGKLWLVTGSPGGGLIITTVANIVMGMVDFGLDVQQAVNAPRFHHQWMPDSIYMEPSSFSPDTVRLLQARGHSFTWKSPWGDELWGAAESIAIDAKSGERLGASDPRRNGKAMGY